ncbi:unnamed protein product [Urochloa decumbens]|uniref:F-box domain-containing protein n=1 Tax=Urochloa decumbens TaxID=240449 RepID=A0ABC9GCR9_9POAL
MPPSGLMDEMVEEVLLRFPPREPACLARVALVCKRWRRLISDPRLPPPGVGRVLRAHDLLLLSPIAADGNHNWRAEDARHGRVLLSRVTMEHILFMAWDPITDQRQELPVMPRTPCRWRTAVIFCSATATGTCNHLDYCRGPFHVVYSSERIGGSFVCIYSSEAAAWSKPASAYLPAHNGFNTFAQSVLVGKTLYSKFYPGTVAIGYDCELCKVVPVISLPQRSMGLSAVLITTEDGGLGCAVLLKYSLYLWSRKADYKVDSRWLESRVIDLEGMLGINTFSTTLWMDVVGFAYGIGTIFLRMNNVLYAIDLMTNKAKEVYNERAIHSVVPYMGFCIPGVNNYLISNLLSLLLVRGLLFTDEEYCEFLQH